MANLTFIVDLPIINGDFPVRKLLVYQRVPSTVENLAHWAVREVRSFSSRVPRFKTKFPSRFGSAEKKSGEKEYLVAHPT